jgi:hypothetical protein
MQAYSSLSALNIRLDPSPLSRDSVIIHLVAPLFNPSLVYNTNQPLEPNDIINDHLYHQFLG